VGARLVARGGAGHARDGLHEGLRRDPHDRGVAHLGQLRELVGRQRAQVEARGPADDLHVALGGAVLEREVVLRERPDDVEQQPAGEDDDPGPLDLGLGLHAHAELHVGGLELHAAVLLGLEANAGEGLDRAAGRDAANGDAEAADELFS
jgi:hypothetical protein